MPNPDESPAVGVYRTLAESTQAALVECVAENNRLERDNKLLENENQQLRAALAALVRINEEHNEAVTAITGRPLRWKDDYLNAARAALGLDQENPE